MIIETRYRDVPFEQLRQCVPNATMTRQDWENKWRGQPITIYVPAKDRGTRSKFVCEGPIFEVTRPSKHENYWVAVCPHIAEIGD